MDLDESDSPLKAAEHYAAATRLFAQARADAAEPEEVDRIDNFVVQCRERFSACELRVQQSKAAAEAAQAGRWDGRGRGRGAAEGDAKASGREHESSASDGWLQSLSTTLSSVLGPGSSTRRGEHQSVVPPARQPPAAPSAPAPPPSLLAASKPQSVQSQHMAGPAVAASGGDAAARGGRGCEAAKGAGAGGRRHAAGRGAGGHGGDRGGGGSGGGKGAVNHSTAGQGAGAERAGRAGRAGPGGVVGADALKGVDKALAKVILDELLDSSPGVGFEDIAGLTDAKEALREAIVLPALRPDLFHGLRAPPKGILLFGPPGNGKTLLAKAVASECASRFFTISASSLTSKWVGQSEKLVRALFAVAAQVEPAVIFIDEVDSILSARSANENEASRRLKTEFLVQFDGVGTAAASRVVVVAATNRPHELDEAVIRRFTRRILIPLPDAAARQALVAHLLSGQACAFTAKELHGFLIACTEGYSGADLAALCKDAALAPLRELGTRIQDVPAASVRAITAGDLRAAAARARPSVSKPQLRELIAWNDQFGSYAFRLPRSLE